MAASRLREAVITADADTEIARLEAVRTLSGEVHRLAESLEQLVRLTADICHAPIAIISLIDEVEQIYIASVGTAIDRIRREDSFCTHIIANGGVFHTGDARKAPHLSGNPLVLPDDGIRSYAAAPILNEGGHAVGTVCILSLEVDAFGEGDVRRLEQVAALVGSAFRRIEAEVKAREAEERARTARAERAHYEHALRAIAEGVHFYNGSGVIIDANESAGQMFRIRREDVLGVSYRDPAWVVFAQDGSALQPDEFPVHRALTTGETVRDVILGVRRADGETCWIATNAAPVRDDPEGPVTFVAVTFRDVTDLLRNQENLHAALAEAERANRAKSDFLGVMSHELRTPMNAILGSARILESASLSSVQRESLRVLGDAGQQMMAVLDDLFEITAFETGKIRISPVAMRPDQVVETVVDFFRPDAAARNLHLHLDHAPGLDAPRLIDPNRLRQVLTNLLANALKFTESGGVTVAARLSRNSDGQDILVLEVEDTGIGISPEAIGRIFSPFEQADVSTRRRHGGIGVGLAVVRQLARAMGGDAAVSSEPGRGSRFRVHVEAPPADGAAGGGLEETVKPLDFSPRSVLLVDDNPRNLFVLSTILSGAGHSVTTADSGEAALEILRDRTFDIVLLDMVMPDVDGFDVMKGARQTGANAETPIVACTANVLPQQVVAYREAGAVGVLPKPIDVAEVLSVIAAATG